MQLLIEGDLLRSMHCRTVRGRPSAQQKEAMRGGACDDVMHIYRSGLRPAQETASTALAVLRTVPGGKSSSTTGTQFTPKRPTAHVYCIHMPLAPAPRAAKPELVPSGKGLINRWLVPLLKLGRRYPSL